MILQPESLAREESHAVDHDVEGISLDRNYMLFRGIFVLNRLNLPLSCAEDWVLSAVQ